MNRIKDSARTLTELEPGTTINAKDSGGKKIFSSKGSDVYNQIMDTVTGTKGSSMNLMSHGIGTIPQGYTGEQMQAGFEEFAPFNKFMTKTVPGIIENTLGAKVLKGMLSPFASKAKDVGSGIMGTKIVQDLSAAPRGFLTDVKNLGRSIFGGLGGFLPSGSGQAGLIPAERLYDRESPADRGGVVDAAQSIVDNIYGSRIGVTGPVTGDFRDSDGDGIDDRYQTGPGMKYQGPEQGGNLKMPGFTTGPIMMPPHMYPPRFAPAMTTDIAASQAAGYDIPYTQRGIADPNLAQYYQNLNLFPRAV